MWTIRCLVFLLATLAPSLARATAQFPEQLIYKGKTLPLYSQPLEPRLSSYWEEPSFGRSGRRPRVLEASSTACWRGYLGTWKVEQGQLWLVALHPCDDYQRSGKPIPIGEVFPGESTPLKAAWFTGVLRVPLGKRLVYVHMGFHSVYEQDLCIAVRAGKVVGEKKIDSHNPDTPL